MFPFFLLDLLLLGTVGVIVVGCLIVACKKRSGAALLAALLLALPMTLLGGFVWVELTSSSNTDEANPQKAFSAIFDAPLPATVTHLRAYSDGDESNPVFLQFQAPPATIQTLLHRQFRPISNAGAQSALDDAQQFTLKPAWFDTALAPNARVYELARRPINSGYIAIHDPQLNRVRVYLDNPLPLHPR